MLPLLLFSGGAAAQEASLRNSASPVHATGTVSGRVVLADTNAPARFARVLLKSVTPNTAEPDLMSMFLHAPGWNQDETKKVRDAASQYMSGLDEMMVSTTVGADGVYLFTNVDPGTYYVHAMAAGYVDPMGAFSADELSSDDPEMRQRVARSIPVVIVAGGGNGHADLRMERGAALSGRVLYDDGSPAVGWVVSPVRSTPKDLPPAALGPLGLDLADFDFRHLNEASTTDDRGFYRVAGLPPGRYVLRAQMLATVPGHSALNPVATTSTAAFGVAPATGSLGLKLTPATGLRLTVYSGDALRRGEAKSIALKAAEEHPGYDITVPLRRMHTVAGVVSARMPGHDVSGGSVELTREDADGKEDPMTRLSATIEPDGSFRFDYVPGDTRYKVKAVHAVEAVTVSTMLVFGSRLADQKISRTYGPAATVVDLEDRDVADVSLQVPENSPPH